MYVQTWGLKQAEANRISVYASEKGVKFSHLKQF